MYLAFIQFPSPTLLYAAESLNARKQLLDEYSIKYSDITRDNHHSTQRNVLGVEFVAPGNLRVVIGALNSSRKTPETATPNVPRIEPHPIAIAVNKCIMNPEEDFLFSEGITSVDRSGSTKSTKRVSESLGDCLGIVVPISRPAPLLEYTQKNNQECFAEEEDTIEAEMDIAEGMAHLEKVLQEENEGESTDIPILPNHDRRAPESATENETKEDKLPNPSMAEVERKEVEESNPWKNFYAANKHELQSKDPLVSNMLWWKNLGFEMGSLHSDPYDWALVSDGSTMVFLLPRSQKGLSTDFSKPLVSFFPDNVASCRQILDKLTNVTVRNEIMASSGRASLLPLKHKYKNFDIPFLLAGDNDPNFWKKFCFFALLGFLLFCFLIFSIVLWSAGSSWSDVYEHLSIYMEKVDMRRFVQHILSPFRTFSRYLGKYFNSWLPLSGPNKLAPKERPQIWLPEQLREYFDKSKEND